MSEEDIERLIQYLNDCHTVYEGKGVDRNNLVKVLLWGVNNYITHEIGDGLYQYFKGDDSSFYLIDGYLFGNVMHAYEGGQPLVVYYEMNKIKEEERKVGTIHYPIIMKNMYLDGYLC